MRNTFQRAGISVGLARLLLADPTTFRVKISELKRTIVRQIHPDTNRQIADSDFGTISAAFDELQSLTNDQLAEAAYKIDHSDESQAVELMELQLYAQNLERRLEEAKIEALKTQEAMRKECVAFLHPQMAGSASAAVLLLWDKPLEIHEGTLLTEEKLKWVTNSIVPKTRLHKFDGSIRVITPSGVVFMKQFNFSLIDEGADTSRGQTRFIGGSYDLYDEKLQEFVRALRSEIETGNPPPSVAGILLGFARPSPALSQLINRLTRRHSKRGNLLGRSILNELSYSQIKEVCQPVQPADDDYYLALWRFTGAGGVLSFERYRKPLVFSIRP